MKNDIRKAMESAGITGSELAEEMGISESLLYRKIDGPVGWKLREIEIMMRHFDIGFNEFAGMGEKK